MLSYIISLFFCTLIPLPLYAGKQENFKGRFFFFSWDLVLEHTLVNPCLLLLQAHSNETVGSIRWKIAKMLNSPVDNIQIFANDSLVC